MSGGPTVMIAGAGVLGLATALALADAGCAVTVYDPGGLNASRVAAGMIAPVFEAVLDPGARAHFDLLLAARDLWPALALRAGIELDRCGTVAVGEDSWLDGVVRGFGALGVTPTGISGQTAMALSPGLSMDGRRAVMTRDDWHLDAPSSLGALRDAASAAGVTFERGRVHDDHKADLLVVATGADPILMAPEQARLTPIKGQIVRVTVPTIGAVVRGVGVYVTPGGATVFGATMEPGRSDATVEAAQVQPLLEAGLRLFPGLAGSPVEIAAGVRAATPDGLPMVGFSARRGVFLAVGARRNGWLLAPLVAQIIAAYVTGRDPGPYAARLDPARFTEG